jgi:tetratricopeptide (TPR) repeat protein
MRQATQLQTAFSLHSSGQFATAKIAYERYIKAHPHDHHAKGWFAGLLAQMGRKEDAFILINVALEADPNNPDFIRIKGNLLLETGQYEDALRHFRLGLSFLPDDGPMLIGGASCQLALNDPIAAKQTAQKAVKVMSTTPQAWLNLGKALSELGEELEAIEALKTAVSLKSDYHAARLALAQSFVTTKKYEKALEHLEILRNYAPMEQKWLPLLSETLRKLGKPKRANLVIPNEILDTSRDPNLFIAKGACLKDLGHKNQAREAYRKALEIDSTNVEALTSQSFLELSNLNFSWGWELLEKAHSHRVRDSNPNLPAWRGECTAEPVLVLAEQGLGDQILFLTLLSEVKNKARNVTVQCDRRLLPILQETHPEVCFVDRNTAPNKKDFAFVTRLSHLGKIFRPDLGSFNRQRDKSITVSSNDKFTKSTFIQRYGISWKSIGAGYSGLKSLDLELFSSYLGDSKTEVFSLQYGDVSEEIDKFNQHSEISLLRVPGLDVTNCLHELAQFMLSCDLIITVSNSTAHLAGGLGVSTKVICPEHGGRHWYWDHHINGQSLWYPSVEILSIHEFLGRPQGT